MRQTAVFSKTLLGSLLFAALLLLTSHSAPAGTIVLRDGTRMEGEFIRIPEIKADPKNIVQGARPVLLLDDDLRRVFLPFRNVDGVEEGGNVAAEVRINIFQPVPRNAAPVNRVGAPLNIERFDDFGRRNYTMATEKGPLTVTQGITLITPVYTKVEAISVGARRPLSWDMRIATSSIPADQLDRVLQHELEIHKKRGDAFKFKLNMVRLYIGMERYSDAGKMLDEISQEFPGQAGQNFDRVARDLKQSQARRLLAEVKVRAAAGQHRLAYAMLNKFPAEGVAGEILQEVQELLDDYQRQNNQGQQVLKLLEEDIKALPAGQKKSISDVHQEMVAQMNINTLQRMSAYLNIAQRAKLEPGERVSRAISGWILGSDGATENLAVALSLYKVRAEVRKYFNEELLVERDLLLRNLKSLEGATPEVVAKILAHMTPPQDTQPQETPGFFTLEVAGLPGEAPLRYYVQLPPEYDPYRKYPAVLTLSGAATTALHQVDWWAGSPDEESGQRRGQAMRQGYIVIAPEWRSEHQKLYEFSLREHVAALNTLRDTCRRFAIDSDRVYLSGHSLGGTAAWDIGLAHPDLWAGVIPIVAEAGKFIDHYADNAEYVPLYLVGGAMDGDRLGANALSLDRYMKGGDEVRVVEYLGRGHEHFSDEQLHIFEWMGRYRRNFFPKKFECVTMRRFDNYFWWVEMAGLPDRAVVEPSDWPPQRGTRAMPVEAKLPINNNVFVQTGADRTTIWLSPDMVDFDQSITIQAGRRRLRYSAGELQPSLETLLEDVRTRGDRQHPFWAKVVVGETSSAARRRDARRFGR